MLMLECPMVILLYLKSILNSTLLPSGWSQEVKLCFEHLLDFRMEHTIKKLKEGNLEKIVDPKN